MPGKGGYDFAKVICPLCSASSTPLPTHPAAELFRCKGCSHAFTNPESIHEAEQYGESYYDEVHQRWFQYPNVALFQRILQQIPQGASVVDVGCGRGDFLRFARKQRPDLRLTGIDLSPNENEPGLTFYQGDILDLPLEGQFDVVVSLAVIEHIVEVRTFVQRMQQLSRPGGTVVVMTLNDGSLLYASARAGRRLGVSLAFDRLYAVHHVHHFTRASLAELLRGCGCIVREHWDHNAPVEAMDLPVKSPWLDSVLRQGLKMVFAAGRLTRRSYLQTIVCTVDSRKNQFKARRSPRLGTKARERAGGSGRK